MASTPIFTGAQAITRLRETVHGNAANFYAMYSSILGGIVNDPASGPVFVHCVGGRHRTGVMTASYRMTHEGWTAERAFSEMIQYKFGADFLHPEFKGFVYSYHPAEAAVATSAAALR